MLIFLLIRGSLKEIDEIVIDEEYSGHASLIKNFLLQEIKRLNPQFPKENINFRRISRKSQAHFIAYGVATGKRQADIKVGAKDILKIVRK